MGVWWWAEADEEEGAEGPLWSLKNDPGDAGTGYYDCGKQAGISKLSMQGLTKPRINLAGSNCRGAGGL